MGNLGFMTCVVLMLWFSPECLRAAYAAAGVFASGVMPALFPMMVLANLPPAGKRSEKKGGWGAALSAIGFAFGAGSPAGAKRVAALAERGEIAPAETPGLFVAAGVMSPLFFLGTLRLWTGNPQAAWIMLLAHWLSALAVGLLGGRFLARGKETPTQIGFPSSVTSIPAASFWSALPEAVASAAKALLSVCGAMMLFSIMAAVLRTLLTTLFPAWVAEHGRELAIVHALLEIGSGANAVLRSFVVMGDHGYALLCALCSFGGLSIWLQNLNFVRKSIRPGILLLLRGIHGAAAYGICRLMLLLWPQAVQTAALTDFSSVLRPLPLPLPALCLLALLPVLASFWRKSRTCLPHS